MKGVGPRIYGKSGFLGQSNPNLRESLYYVYSLCIPTGVASKFN